MSYCPRCRNPVSIWMRGLLSGLCSQCEALAATERRRAAEDRAIAAKEQRPERRRQELESAFQHYARLYDWPHNDVTSRFVLTVGQIASLLACIASVLGCVVTPLTVADQLHTAAIVARDQPDQPAVGQLQFSIVLMGIVSVASCMISAVISLAVFVVFGRSKWVARLAECQRAIIHRIQQGTVDEGN